MTSAETLNAILVERKRIRGIIRNATFLTIEQQDMLIKRVEKK